MVSRERRRHVRPKPIPELPARATLGDGLLREALDVVDISVAGLSLRSPALKTAKELQRMKLAIVLGEEELAVDVIVRWVSGDAIGAEFSDLSQTTAKSVERYVAELLERGGSS